MVETNSNMGFLMALYVASNVSLCFLHVVDVSALSSCLLLRAFVVLYGFLVCGFGVESDCEYFGVKN